MKIIYDYQTFTLQSYGGISRYFIRLAEELKAKGNDVNIFAPYHCNQLLTELPEAMVKGVKISSEFSKPSALMMLLANHLISRKAIKKWRPDIFHETYFSLRSNAPIGCPTVVTVYDMIHEKFPKYFSRFDPTGNWKEKAVNRATHIICISESTKRDLLELFPHLDNKVSVVHLGFSTSQVIEEIENGQRPYLLYVGTRNGHKNFLTLLNAFASSQKLRAEFNLIAFGGGAFTTSEIWLINGLGLKETQITQVGGNDEILAGYYKNASAFIYPSIYEGFGLPPLEAMAQNCPVVSSNTSSMPEVIGDAGEFFDPNSIDEMREAIESVVFSSLRSRELIELGKKRLEMFTWQNCANHTLNIYNKLI